MSNSKRRRLFRRRELPTKPNVQAAMQNLAPLCMRVPWDEFRYRMKNYNDAWPIIARDMRAILGEPLDEDLQEKETQELPANDEPTLADPKWWWYSDGTVPVAGIDQYATMPMAACR